MRLANLITVVVFVLLILSVSVNQVSNFISDIEYNENKKKADFPAFDINSLDPFPKQFEAFLSDNFSLRGRFLKVMGLVNLRIWKKTAKPNKLILGKEGWLFNVGKELNCYLEKTKLTNAELELFLNEFVKRHNVLSEQGIKMYLVINPTKFSVYPEYLPDFIQRKGEAGITKQLVDYLHENSAVSIINPRNELLKLKNEHQLFYKGDNHWNNIGGFYAAKHIVNTIDSNSGLELSDFCLDTLSYKGNLANMTGVPDEFVDDKINLSLCKGDAKKNFRFKHKVVPGFPYPWDYQKSYKSQNKELGNILVIRDSFGSALIPYIKNSFYHSTFIFDSWNYAFNYDIIEKEKPDIVVYMMLESLIPGFISKLKVGN